MSHPQDTTSTHLTYLFTSRCNQAKLSQLLACFRMWEETGEPGGSPQGHGGVHEKINPDRNLIS